MTFLSRMTFKVRDDLIVSGLHDSQECPPWSKLSLVPPLWSKSSMDLAPGTILSMVDNLDCESGSCPGNHNIGIGIFIFFIFKNQ